MRNLVEMLKGQSDADYIKLTSLLHWKPDTAAIVQNDLDQIFASLFGGAGAWATGTQPVSDLIQTGAQSCLAANAGINFEHKIVLSIAIRLAAEKYMVTKLSDEAFWRGIVKDQTPVLLEEFERRFGTNSVLRRVALMTPANIHLNSFMYEPILDMSDEHLKKLYTDVLALT
jgi:hypothetical protein